MSKKSISALPNVSSLAGATAQEQAYRRLRYAIMIGHIGPGVALTIRGLAQILDVSPTPVREALRRLAAECAITVLDNRRVMTPAMNASRFDELIAVRTALECHCAERAIPHISEIVINEMEQIDLAMDDAVKTGDHETTVILNLQFHTLLFTSNPGQVVMPMIESVWLQLGPFTRLAIQHMGSCYTIDRHKEIIAGLRQRDTAIVSSAIEADIRDGMSHLGRLGLIHEYNANRDSDAA